MARVWGVGWRLGADPARGEWAWDPVPGVGEWAGRAGGAGGAGGGGPQDAAFDLRQAGEVGVGQFLEERLCLLVACGDVAGCWPQGRGALIAGLRQGAAWVAHERLA